MPVEIWADYELSKPENGLDPYATSSGTESRFVETPISSKSRGLIFANSLSGGPFYGIDSITDL